MARVRITQDPAAPPISIATGPANSSQNIWVSLIKQTIPPWGFSYLEKLAYYANTAGTTITFAVFLNNVQVLGAFYTRNTQLGTIGNPYELPVPLQLPGGGLLEIKVYDTGATPISCEGDGEINTYAKSL